MKMYRNVVAFRWCWRRPWRFRAPMVIFPQQVPYFGAIQFADLGEGICLACGKKHGVYGTHSIHPLDR